MKKLQLYRIQAVFVMLISVTLLTQKTEGQTPTTLTARLVHGTRNKGILEVKYNGTWGRVCDYTLGDDELDVACRTLGFGIDRSTFLPVELFSTSNVSLPIYSVMCEGHESTLAECNISPTLDCLETGYSALTCDVPGTEIRFRLNGTSPTSGLLEMSVAGVWGTICHDGFNNTAAEVVCRSLGLPYQAAIAVPNAGLGQGKDDIWLDYVACKGTETSLINCQNGGLNRLDCTHDEDVGIICNDNQTLLEKMEVRLIGHDAPWAGIVEVKYAGVWGTVCDELFGVREAGVICKMLGYTANATVRYGIPSNNTGPIWLTGVNCTGTETNIGDCRHRVAGDNVCSHIADVAVICLGGITPINVRLVNGTNRVSGRVEVNIHGVWGTVCDEEFTNLDAMVVCRQLGYHNGAVAVGNARFGQGRGPILLHDVVCSGTESTLAACLYKRTNNCHHSEDVGVICNTDFGVECYNCDGINDPSKCRDTINCRSIESCQISMYEINHQILYSQSCQSKLVCQALNSIPSIIGRKRVTGMRITCCDTALCNNAINGTHVIQGHVGAPGSISSLLLRYSFLTSFVLLRFENSEILY